MNVPYPALTRDYIESLIETKVINHTPDTTFMSCVLTLKNTYIVTGTSRPVNDSIFDYDIGEEEAYENALKEIWKFEGYLARSVNSGILDSK